jgi:hypothetical protein
MTKKTRLSNTPRKLTDSSWLAQTIKDKMEMESEKMGMYASSKWHNLHTFHIIANEADNTENTNIYYNNCNGKQQIIICEIPSLISKYGYDYDREGMQARLRGLAERYKDDDGMYLVSVLTTNDLNSATIKDVSELLYQIGTH